MDSNAPRVSSTTRVPLPMRLASMRCTGVAKSVTSSGFCSDGGRLALPMSMTTPEDSLRRSGVAPSLLKLSTSCPAPPSPRRKSIFDTLTAPGTWRAGSAAAGSCEAAISGSAAPAAGIGAACAAKAASKPAARPARAALPGRKRACRARWAWVTVIVLSSESLIVQRNRRRALQPATCTVGHQLHQVDAGVADVGHPAFGLAHVHPRPHPVGHLVRRYHQRHLACAGADAADHVEAVERELLEQFLAPVRVGPRAAGAAFVGEGVAEGVAQALRGVLEGLELLHHRQRVERGRRALLHLGHPLLEIRGIVRATGHAASAGGGQ